MKRGSVVLVNLEPTIGSEIKKTRPCIVISPNEMNDVLRTVMVIPITSKHRELPTRILLRQSEQNGLSADSYAVLDQIRTIDKLRIIRSMGCVNEMELQGICDSLCEMFAFEE